MEEEDFHGEVLSDLMGEMAEIIKAELPQDAETYVLFYLCYTFGSFFRVEFTFVWLVF